MKLELKSLFVCQLLFCLLVFSENAGSHDAQELLSEMEFAAEFSATSLDKVGMDGLIKIIEGCYKRPNKSSAQNYGCIYLDFAARHIEQSAAVVFKKKPRPFFYDKQFQLRIYPLLKDMGWTKENIPLFMKGTEVIMKKKVDDAFDKNSFDNTPFQSNQIR